MARQIEGESFELPALGFSPQETSSYLNRIAELVAQRVVSISVAQVLTQIATANTSAYKVHRENTDVPRMEEMLKEMQELDARAEGRATAVQQGRRASH